MASEVDPPTDRKFRAVATVLLHLCMRHGAAVIATSLGALISGCGPSVQSIYEGNVRFEHCYRLDLDPAIAPPHREACWVEWLGSYTYGQTTDRVEYARRRLIELKTSSDSMVLHVSAEPEEGSPADPAEAPAPITVHRPPPPTAGSARSFTGTPTSPPDRPPGHDCARRCEELWRSCQAGCSTGTRIPLCESCATDYRGCVQRCFN